jgi:hypothetical protein
LLAGLLLPWIAGGACLYPWRHRLGVGPAGIAGYGFFAGCALLYLLLLALYTLLGEVTFWPLAGSLAICGVLGLLGGTRLSSQGPGSCAGASQKPAPDWITVGLLILAGIHLVPIAIEIHFRPVFPWDAWQTWIYKAKAWFFSGGPAKLDLPAQWLIGEGGATYNAPAADYPGLVPAMAYWAALCIGSWSETRVNAPVLLCGVAICLALWDQVRTETREPRLAAAACLLFLSTPLVGTHLSLGGYADIWLAGFSGLGLVALLRGLQQEHRAQLVLGLIFLAAGLLVKRDASLWLVCGLALFLVVRHPRIGLLALSTGALCFGALVVLGQQQVTLPYLGAIGVSEGVLTLGPLGSWPLEPRNVLPDYLFHLFVGGSWNLLWYFVAIASVLLIGQCPRRVHRPLGWFLLLLVTSQGILFGLTAAGRWAQDGTALNRLLLHPLPALLSLLMLVCASWDHKRPMAGAKAPQRVARSALVATLAVCIGATVWLQVNSTDGEQSRRFDTKRLRTISGEAKVDGGSLVITRFQHKAAVVSTGPIAVAASQLSLIELESSTRNSTPRLLFWRQVSSPAELHTEELSVGRDCLDLRGKAGWEGTITEVGVVLYEDADQQTGIAAINLHAASRQNLLRLILDEWTAASRWTQKSINSVPIGTGDSLLPLPLLLGSWLLVAIVTLGVAGSNSVPRSALTILVLTGWLLLDLRWLGHSFSQAWTTWDHYARTRAPDALAMGGAYDSETVELARHVREALGTDRPRRIIIAAGPGGTDFQILRAKYALLPHAGYAHLRELDELPTQRAEAILLVTGTRGDSMDTPPYLLSNQGRRFDAVAAWEAGTLYLPDKGS